MWLGMDALGSAAALYFVAWIIIGNYIMLNLFLALLINNFQVSRSFPGIACGGFVQSKLPQHSRNA
jgi:hypothetical protein